MAELPVSLPPTVPPTPTVPPVVEPVLPFALLATIRKHWLLVLTVVALVAGGVTFITLGQTRIFEAKATVLFDPAVPRPLGDQNNGVLVADGSSYWNNKEYYRTQEWVVQSMRVATEVVRQLGLHKNEAFMAPMPKPRRAAMGDIEAAATLLLSQLEVSPVRDSRLMTLQYRDADPQRARQILTTLVDTYVQQNLDEVFESATVAADWLRSQVGALRKDLESSEMALHSYKHSKNLLSVSLDDQSNMLREEMKQLNTSLTQVRVQREHVASRVAALKEVSGDDPNALPAIELIESPVLQRLRQDYVDSTKHVDALLQQGKGENHPDVRAARASQLVMRTSLLAEVRNIQGAYERQLAAADREIASLRGLYQQAEKRALSLGLLEIEYNRLLRNKDNDEKLFSLVIERSKETDLTRMLRVNNIRVVDRPQVPDHPVKPNVPLNLAGGLFAGILLGVCGAVARERLDRTIRVPEDIEREAGLPFLGLLPEIAGTAAHNPRTRRLRRRKHIEADSSAPELIVHDQPTSGAAEAARALRTNIMFMSPDRPFRTLLVTSAGPSEGKTTVACALAVTMAQAGQRVVIVDCDLRRPRLHRVFQSPADTGLTTALIERGSVARIAHETCVPNLSVITAGPQPPNPAELLQSESFRAFFHELREHFDRVIIDSPPLVPVTDAAVLSTLVDGTVLVVRASRTTRELASRASRSLRDVSARIVGVVLNAVNLQSRYYNYYQYFYYRREGYTSRPEEAPPTGSARA